MATRFRVLAPLCLGAIGLVAANCAPPQPDVASPGAQGKADAPLQGPAATIATQVQLLADSWVQQALDEHGVPALRASFSGAEALAQITQFANQVSFADALGAALTSYLEDGRDLESPRGLLAEFGDPSRDLTEQVREALQQPDSELMLVHRTSVSGGVADDHRIGWAPEGGESIVDNWAFELVVPTLGDHSHWAIVDRARGPQGEIKVFNYGFN